MATDYISVDAQALNRLIVATVQGDIEAARAAVDEMALCARGVDRISRVIQIAKKHERGIVDQERAVAEPYPIPGLRVGSTLANPKLAEAS